MPCPESNRACGRDHLFFQQDLERMIFQVGDGLKIIPSSEGLPFKLKREALLSLTTGVIPASPTKDYPLEKISSAKTVFKHSSHPTISPQWLRYKRLSQYRYSPQAGHRQVKYCGGAAPASGLDVSGWSAIILSSPALVRFIGLVLWYAVIRERDFSSGQKITIHCQGEFSQTGVFNAVDLGCFTAQFFT